VVITGGTALIGMLVFLLALLFGMCIFYILTPIVMFAILSGANPGTAVTGNMRTAAIAAMAGAGSAARIIQKSNVNVSPQVNRSIQSLSPKSPASPGISLNSVTKAMRLTK
jgi:zona occludens toxin (predicted ATPase)